MQPPTPLLPAPDWIAIAAHALAYRFPHVPPDQLAEVAADLHRHGPLHALAPADAVALWLQPLDGAQAAA